MAELLSEPVRTSAEVAIVIANAAMLHDQRAEFVGRHRTRQHLEQLGERVPDDLAEAGDIAAVDPEAITYATRSAACWVRTLDPEGLGRQQLHVVTTEATGVGGEGLGFTLPGPAVFEMVRDHLPRSAEPGPVVFVSVAAHLRQIADHLGPNATDDELRQRLRIAITATTLHEAAHVVEQQLAAEAVAATSTIDHLRAMRAMPRQAKPHTTTWARCLGHLVRRAMPRPPAGYWRPWLAREVEHDIPGTGRRWFPILEAETANTDNAEPLIEVIRRPNPEFDLAIDERRNAEVN